MHFRQHFVESNEASAGSLSFGEGQLQLDTVGVREEDAKGRENESEGQRPFLCCKMEVEAKKKKKKNLRVVMRAVLWVECRGVKDMTKAGVGLIEAHDLLMELVDLFLGSGTEGEVVQAWVGLVVGSGRVTRRDAND